MTIPTSVLYVTCDGASADRAAAVFDADYPTLALESAPSVETARRRLAGGDVDCVVAANELDEESGIAFLSTLAADVAGILYVADPPSGVVREAYDCGVDDVVTEAGEGSVHVLAGRVLDAVESLATDPVDADPSVTATIADDPQSVTVAGDDAETVTAAADSETAAAASDDPAVTADAAPDRPRDAASTRPSDSPPGSPAAGATVDGFFDGIHGSGLRQYRRLLDTVGDGVYALDAGGRFLAVNDAYADIVGYSREELLGTEAREITGDALNAQAVEKQTALERGEEVSMLRLDLPHRDGDTVPVEVHVSLLPLDDGTYGRVGVVRDVSERERLKHELAEVFERVTDAFFALDAEMEFTFVNERAEELIEKSAAELLGESIWKAFPGAVDTVFESEYRRAMREQVAVSFEAYFDPLARWFHVHAYPSETGLSVYFRDVSERKRQDRRLAGLNETMRTLVETSTTSAVLDVAAETAQEVLGLPNVVVATYDETAGTLRPTSGTATTAARLDPALLDADDALAWQAFVDGDTHRYDSLSTELETETTMESALLLSLGRHGVLLSASPDPDGIPESAASLSAMLTASVQSALDRADREETLRKRTETLERKNESLERLRRINGVIRQLTRGLTAATTREEIFEGVCTRLAVTEPYGFAWVGSQDSLADTVAVEATAGMGGGLLDALRSASTSSSDAGTDCPASNALGTAEPQVYNTLRGDPPFEPWRQAALKQGFRSCIAVPLVHRETRYGVLCLYATEPDVFNRMEQTVLTELGEIIGHALNALERKRALTSEHSVELDFETRGPLDQPLRLVADLGCSFEFRNLVQRSDGLLHLFFTVTGADPDDVEAAAANAVDIERITHITSHDDEALYECSLVGSTMFASLLDRGIVPSVISATGDDARIVLRLPQHVDTRSVVDLFGRKFDRAELTARRERDDPVWTRQEFKSEFENQLTERQEEVLRTAYFAGFFEWPRESTGEEIAAMLDVSQPTVLRHVRGSEKKLFSLLFDGE